MLNDHDDVILYSICPRCCFFTLFLVFIIFFIFNVLYFSVYWFLISNGDYIMVYDWSEIELTTVRDVTDSYIWVLHLRYFL